MDASGASLAAAAAAALPFLLSHAGTIISQRILRYVARLVFDVAALY